MAVTATRIKDVRGGITESGGRQYTIVWHVDTNDVNDGPITARQSTDIPFWLDPFSHGNDVDAAARMVTKQAKLLSVDASYKLWEVTGTFKTPDAQDSKKRQAGDEVDHPLDKPVEWSGSFVQFSKDFMQDKDAAQIKNSAGDPFIDPPITGDDSRMSIVAKRNLGSLDVDVWAQFRDAVNDGVWWGLAARKIKVQSITWEQQFFDATAYYPVTFEFHVNDDTWDVSVLDAGLRERVSGQNIPIRLAPEDKPVSSPWPLTTAGAQMSEANVDSGNENYKTFKIYKEKDFSLLGLPAILGA